MLSILNTFETIWKYLFLTRLAYRVPIIYIIILYCVKSQINKKKCQLMYRIAIIIPIFIIYIINIISYYYHVRLYKYVIILLGRYRIYCWYLSIFFFCCVILQNIWLVMSTNLHRIFNTFSIFILHNFVYF